MELIENELKKSVTERLAERNRILAKHPGKKYYPTYIVANFRLRKQKYLIQNNNDVHFIIDKICSVEEIEDEMMLYTLDLETLKPKNKLCEKIDFDNVYSLQNSADQCLYLFFTPKDPIQFNKRFIAVSVKQNFGEKKEHKLLLEKNETVVMLLYKFRKNIKLESQEALTIFLMDKETKQLAMKMVTGNTFLIDLLKEQNSEDGILYLQICKENAFGLFKD